MAVVRDQIANATMVHGNVSSLAVVFSVNPAAGSTVLVGIADVSNFVSSVVDNGTTVSTFVQDVQLIGVGPPNAYIYRANYITLPSAGSYTVTVTFSGVGLVAAGAISYKNVQRGAPEVTNTNDQSGTNVTGLGTGAAAASVASHVYFGVGTEDGTTAAEGITTGNGFTQRSVNQDGTTGQPTVIGDLISTGSRQATFSWTNASPALACIAAYPQAPALGLRSSLQAVRTAANWAIGLPAGWTRRDRSGLVIPQAV